MGSRSVLLVLIVLGCAAAGSCSRQDDRQWPPSGDGALLAPAPGSRSSAPIRLPDVPYVTTPHEVVEAMLRLAKVGREDIVFDLGCGDGRIVIAAVRDFGARGGACVEIDPMHLREARRLARRAGVEERILFVEGDLFEVDLREATVVTLYLLPSLNLKLRPKLLEELTPGSRVVSHEFSMGDWAPEEELQIAGTRVLRWTIPGPRSPTPGLPPRW